MIAFILFRLIDLHIDISTIDKNSKEKSKFQYKSTDVIT